MPVPSSIGDLSTTPGSNSPAGSESPTTFDDYMRTIFAFIAQLRDGKGQSKPVDLASAATTDIGAQASQILTITGTTTITSFGTNYNGPRFLVFSGALTLTHNATSLILPGGANITTAAGDCAIAIPNSATPTGWRVVSYVLASLVPGALAGILPVAQGGTGADNAAAARANLGIPTREVGEIADFLRATLPSGWIKASGTIGSASSGATNRANADTEPLFTLWWNDFSNTILPIQNSAGSPTTRGASAAADFAANKRLPVFDIRGLVRRALDDGRGVDSGRVLGSEQMDAFQGHNMEISMLGGTGSSYGFGGTTGNANVTNPPGASIGPPVSNGTHGTPRTAAETRMRNIAVLVGIKL